MANKIPSFLTRELPSAPLPARRKVSRWGRGTLRASFIDKGLKHVAGVVNTGYSQWEAAAKEGPLQRLDARVKVFFFLFFIVIISLKKEVYAEVAISAFIFLLAAISRINLFRFYKRALFFGFIFGFLVALPASLSSITGGEIAVPLITFPKAYDFWIYHIPANIAITKEGLHVVTLLTLRVFNSISLSFLVFSTTLFPELIKALKALKVPDIFLMMLTLSYKYILIFARTIGEIHLAKKSRLIGEESSREGRNWIADRIAFIFRKTRLKCEDVFKAMVGRGYSGEIRLYGPGRLTVADRVSAVLFFIAGLLFLFI